MAQKNPNLSQSDQAAIEAAGREWQVAHAAGDKAAEMAAHNKAEAIRNNNGYSGGMDGSQYIPTNNSSGGSRPQASQNQNDPGYFPPGYSSARPNQQPAQQGQQNRPNYTPKGPWSASNAPVGMIPTDSEALAGYGNQWTQGNREYKDAQARGDRAAMEAAQAKMDQAHSRAEQIRGKYNFSGGMDGSEYIQIQREEPQNMSGLLNQWLAMAQQQQQQAIDYATQHGIDELQRAEADAQVKFDAQMNQTARDELKALDNQALYMEARGDRGGIGQAQYNQIQAQAMQNRQAINAARTKLATDTARQIADLRAQGEFKKADAILQLGQQYLGQLMDIQKWGAEYKLNVNQFNAQLDHWNKEFEMSVGQMMGNYNGAPTLEAQKLEQDRLIELGMAALNMGIRPSQSQIQAMGYTDAQINAMLNEYKLKQQMAMSGRRTSGSGGGGGRSRRPSSKKSSNEKVPSAVYNMVKQFVSEGDSQGLAEYLSQMVEDEAISMEAATQLFNHNFYKDEDRKYWVSATEEIVEYPIDVKSVLDLGYGPVSDTFVENLEARGEIESYIEGGKRKFRKKAKAPSKWPTVNSSGFMTPLMRP